ncbi:MAG: VWA domain-containing protein [Candidatus Woesearchaeota archaeon]
MKGLSRTSSKRAVTFSSSSDSSFNFSDGKRIEELSGSVGRNGSKGLMHSVLENDVEIVKSAKVLSTSINYRIPLNAESIFEEIVKDYKMAKNIYGKTFIREVSGFSEEYVEKNIRIPEFRSVLKKRIEDRLKLLESEGLIENGEPTERGIELAAYISYFEEIDSASKRGILGRKAQVRKSSEGFRAERAAYRKNRYKDLDIAGSAVRAIRRGHTSIMPEDLAISEREKKSSLKVVYALDASGSMSGEKIEQCKKAGIALAYKAILEGDSVGVVVFGKDVRLSLSPLRDFREILIRISAIRPYGETDIALGISEAAELLSKDDGSARHIILISDAVPTRGISPEEDAKRAASSAASSGITISIVGIRLDATAEKLARELAGIGRGRFFRVRELAGIDRIVLEDYYRAS